MNTRLFLCIVLLLFLFVQCKVVSHSSLQNVKVDSNEVKNVFNSDSSYCVVLSLHKPADGLPADFNVFDTGTQQFIYRSNRSYEFLEWENLYLLRVRKYYGIVKNNPRSELSEPKENFADYFLNITTSEISPCLNHNQ